MKKTGTGLELGISMCLKIWGTGKFVMPDQGVCCAER